MTVQILWLAGAIITAVYAAKFLVDGGVALGHKLNIPSFIIGAVIIGFGSSMPEFSVNIGAALKGETGLAMGNILGSNLFNMAFSLGVLSLVSPLMVNRDALVKDLPMHVIAALMVGVCGNQLYFDGINYHELMPSHGIIFLCFFAIYMYYTVLEVGQQSPAKKPLHPSHARKLNGEEILHAVRIPLYIVGGLAGLLWAGDKIVDSASAIAGHYGLQDHTIGLFIVGPGTSLPELVACIAAARKRQTDMILGNIIGSNIFNIFFTLGITALITPVPVDASLNNIIIANIALAVMLWFGVLLTPSKNISRILGAILLLGYFFYIGLSL